MKRLQVLRVERVYVPPSTEEGSTDLGPYYIDRPGRWVLRPVGQPPAPEWVELPP